MDRAAKHRQHDLDRKRHKHEQEQRAREAARRPKSNVAAWVLGVGLLLLIGGVVAVILLA